MDFLHRFLKTAHPTKAEKKILVGLLSILIILCTLTYLSHRNSKRVISSAEAVERSQEIKYHIEQVLAVITDFESTARGYVITGDEKYLEPATHAIDNLFDHLHYLEEVVEKDSVQLSQVHQLSALVDKKIAVSKGIVNKRKTSGITAAIQYMESSESKWLMDKLRAITDTMLKEEDEKLKSERDENRTHIKNFNITFDLMLVKIAISILTVFFILRFYFNARRKSEQLLSENKHLLQSIIDNTSSVIFIKDLSGKYLLINNRYEKLFHISAEEIKGKADHEIFPKEVADAIRAADLKVIQYKKLMEFEEDVPNNGEMRHYLSIKFPLFDAEYNVYAVCGIATDITERKLMEKEIREQSDNILDLFNNAPCGYHSTNSEGILIEMNDTELRWLGFEREEIIGKAHILSLVNQKSHNILKQNFSGMKEGKIEILKNVELIMQRKDGTTFPVEAHVSIQCNENGEFLRTRTTLFDITVRKQAEMLILQN
ncbi:MAG TPA: PAS domain S-box protein [Bacteroidia bacterium]|nr:PAS domain S-box protein [Bacteroidia bacterium]